MTNDSIKFVAAGGVPDIEIPISRKGGLYVLEGPNGAGKSQALQGIGDLTTGERTMKVKHGRSAGSIEGLGVSIRLGARTSRRGELDVVGLEPGRMDIASIVDPGFKQRGAANRGIVKSLCRMAGLIPDLSRFTRLAPGETEEEQAEAFSAMFPDLESDDLVELARKVKDGFDARARIVAAEAERAQGEADALMATGSDLDLESEETHDAADLQSVLEAAIAKQASVKQRAVTYGELEQAAAKARGALPADGGADLTEKTQAAAQLILDLTGSQAEGAERVESATREVTAAQIVLDEAKTNLHGMEVLELAATNSLSEAKRTLDALMVAADGHEAAQAALAALEAGEAPTDADMAEAATAVLQARLANEQGVLVRDALAKREQGLAKRVEAAALAGREQDLREAGRDTDGVLSEMLNEAGIQGMSVVDGEVLAQLPDDPEPRPYLDMSDGERTRAALLATLPVLEQIVPEGECGVVVLGQRVYQDLDYENRESLAAFVEQLGVIVFTALPTDGELRAVKAEA